jgi:NAD(P)-dependent dehydrogenase (short-subunit alcohol dehydrogenase family)
MNDSNEMSLVVVTGAAGGLGSAVCRELLARKWRVAGIDHDELRLAALGKEFANAPFRPILADLASPQLADGLCEVLRGDEGVFGLVHVAAKSRGDEILHLTDEDWSESFAINTTSAMVLARLMAPYMIARGKGAIVNVGSPVGIVGARKPSYAASKAALAGLTMSLARNLGPDGVRANLLLPGAMITPLTEDWSPEKRESIAKQSFLKRLCKPEEVAKVISFLLSEEASCVTGAVMDCTAGSMFGH